MAKWQIYPQKRGILGGQKSYVYQLDIDSVFSTSQKYPFFGPFLNPLFYPFFRPLKKRNLYQVDIHTKKTANQPISLFGQKTPKIDQKHHFFSNRTHT